MPFDKAKQLLLTPGRQAKQVGSDFGTGAAHVGEKVLDKIGLGGPERVQFDRPPVQTKTADELFAGLGLPGTNANVPPPTAQAGPAPARIDPATGRPLPTVSQQPTNPAAAGAAGPPRVVGSIGSGAAFSNRGGSPLTGLGGQAAPALETAGLGAGSSALRRGSQDQFGARQASLANLLEQQARGVGGPTAAQSLLRAGTEDAIRQQLAASTAQSGISSGAALRQGSEAGIGLQRQAVAQGAALRAQEQQQAQNTLRQLLTDSRAGDFERQSLTTQAGLKNRALELEELNITGDQAIRQMTLELDERLKTAGLNLDVEKLRVATELAMSDMDLRVALANANFSAQEAGAILQIAGSFGTSILGLV